ncbi:aminoacetone oxidase family FAD-binding enzyme [Candidatus Wolfebacteria bacterium CG10_big_fil_rev_8_21_14_0_10_31_9]|uniref:Aminoacetone oxidase family FAD-binding enzyme n=1 Tax=Candidatus Wolfebacteria bacterium CG10_big_fil_rev_8_21_14_0_10_31_9 TaxID=1975070 RepID=A0A2H0RCF4_9BACT|nr:MAG: aminoacetone oxidase family FAD-binding enzyme [Candidatus Wolfebacteria bacterium CG10_big_fil_rev_8_21_14_0_10_31_9]
MKNIWDVIVIGGGPAGMISAGRAGELGHSVLLLEKNSTLGKKLLITGGGRCNLTNNRPIIRNMVAQYKDSDKFLMSAFSQFDVVKTLNFFNQRGMRTKEEAGGRIFPTSDKSQSVLDVLIKYMRKGNVEIKTKAIVSDLSIDKKTEHIVIQLNTGNILIAKSCIIATGGASHPETGSTGESFKWLKKIGHTIEKNNFALVPIAVKDIWVKNLAGLTLNDIKLTVLLDNKKQDSKKGRILFTHFGISGPMVLNMSKNIGELLSRGEVIIMLDLFPKLDLGALKKTLQNILIKESNKKLKNTLSAIIPSAIIPIILTMTGVDGEISNHSIRREERKKLVNCMKEIPMHIERLLGAHKAIISSGGVVLEEVNFKTMQSRIAPQIYLIGDVLNINRPSGGYSLQLCWTTGFVAGSNA